MKDKIKNNISSDETMRQASLFMAHRARGLGAVSESVLSAFMKRCPLYKVFILDASDVSFRAYVFFNKNDDVVACRHNGIQDEIINYVYSELERVGRGGRDRINLEFEFDSDENVKNNFEDSYYFRLL